MTAEVEATDTVTLIDMLKQIKKSRYAVEVGRTRRSPIKTYIWEVGLCFTVIRLPRSASLFHLLPQALLANY